MRFEVPQFIEVEDKIIGPLTWRQFIYVAGGVGTLLILYFTLPFIFFAILGLPVAGLAGSLAFQKVNNRPFSIFLESFFNYFTKKRLYIWKRDHIQSVVASSAEEADEFANLQLLDHTQSQDASASKGEYTK